MKNKKIIKKINGGCGEDDHVGAFYDFINTLTRAKVYLWDNKKDKLEVTILSNQTIQDVCKGNITQFVFPKEKQDIKKINCAQIERYTEVKKKRFRKRKTEILRWPYYFIPKKIDLDFYWVNEFDWIMNLKHVKEWKIVEGMENVLIFENEKQVRTGELSW